MISHLAIIPDGNRRLARRLLEQPWKGHEWGIRKMYDVLTWCKQLGIRTVTFYALSLENLEKRPKEELSFLFQYALQEFNDILSNQRHLVHRDRIRMVFFGRLDLLPREIQQKISAVMRATRTYARYTANFAMAYGGRQEIVEAAKRLAAKVKAGRQATVTERSFRRLLQTNGSGDPDLIIRTGGEKRLSNFLTFQSVYAELAFLDTLWPDLTRGEFTRTIRQCEERERRFGK